MLASLALSAASCTSFCWSSLYLQFQLQMHISVPVVHLSAWEEVKYRLHDQPKLHDTMSEANAEEVL